MDFAIAHTDWTIEDWMKVIWSNATKINHLGSNVQKWVWKKAGNWLGDWLSDRLVQGTVKFEGGSVMAWRCMPWQEVGYAAKIDDRMDGDLYLQILKDNLLNTLQYYDLNPSDIIFLSARQ